MNDDGKTRHQSTQEYLATSKEQIAAAKEWQAAFKAELDSDELLEDRILMGAIAITLIAGLVAFALHPHWLPEFLKNLSFFDQSE